MTVEVFAADEQSAEVVDAPRWAELARAVLGAEGVRGDAELSLLFVDEVAMAELNQRFMGHDGPTDVLSFPIDEDDLIPDRGSRPQDSRGPGSLDDEDATDVPRLLGDVVVCPSVARRNAPEHAGPNHAGTVDDEMALLIVHGVLHVLGMDHYEDVEAEAMQQRERELLGLYHRPPRNGEPRDGEPRDGEMNA